MKPVALPPGRAKLSTKPAPTGSGTTTKTIGTVRVVCSNGPTVRCPSQNDVRSERDQFRCVFASVGLIACGPTNFDPHITAIGPAKLLQPLQETPRCGPVLPDRPWPCSRVCRCAAGARPAAPVRRRAARMPPHHSEHRETPAAACPPPGRHGIVSAQTSTLIGAETGFATATCDTGRCPSWVIHVDFGRAAPCPLFTPDPDRTTDMQQRRGDDQPAEVRQRCSPRRRIEACGPPASWRLGLWPWSPPEVLEPTRRQLSVAHGVLDVPVAEVGLQRPGIVALVGQGEATGVPQHVRVNLEAKPGSLPSAL